MLCYVYKGQIHCRVHIRTWYPNWVGTSCLGSQLMIKWTRGNPSCCVFRCRTGLQSPHELEAMKNAPYFRFESFWVFAILVELLNAWDTVKIGSLARARSPPDQIRAKIQFLEPFLCANVPSSNFREWKRPIGEVINISENLSSKGPISRSPDDQIWAKIQFWRRNSILTCQVGDFVNQKRLIGAMLSISENLRSKVQRSRSPDDPIWAKLQFGICNCIQIARWQLLSMDRTYWGSVKYFWKIEVQWSYAKVTRWPWHGQKCSFGAITLF